LSLLEELEEQDILERAAEEQVDFVAQLQRLVAEEVLNLLYR
jgi:hypothetical protein